MRLIFISLILSILVGLGAIAIANQQNRVYEGVAVAQIGSFGELIEEPGSSIIRINNPGFLARIKSLARSKPAIADPLEIQAVVVPNTKFIQVRVLAPDPSSAKVLAAMAVSELRSDHELKMKPFKDHVESRLKEVEKILDFQRSEIKQIDEANPTRIGDAILISTMLNQLRTSARSFEDLKFALRAKYNIPNNQPTSLIGDIYASENPIYPKTFQIGIVAFTLTFAVSYSVQYFRTLKLT